MIHPCNPDILALFARGLKVVHDTLVYKFKDFSECVFDTQIQSKNWLVDTLYDHRDRLGDIKRVSVLASWYGVAFVPIMLRKFPDVIIDLYDVDWYTADIAEYIFKDHNNVNVHCKDVIFDNVEFEGDLIINCSCEHMYDMSEIVNQYRGRSFAFQSNDNRNVKWLHINCVDSAEELIKQTDIKEVIFDGKIQVHRNNRIMVVGK